MRVYTALATMTIPQLGPCPPRFAELKSQIAASYPNFEENVTRAWREVLSELKTVTDDIIAKGSEVLMIPSISCHYSPEMSR